MAVKEELEMAPRDEGRTGFGGERHTDMKDEFSRRVKGQTPDVGNQLCQKIQSGGRKNESRLLKFTLAQGE